MNNNNYKIQKYEAICLIIIVMINKLILNVPYYVSSLVGTGTLANIIYIGILDLILVLIINKLLKKFQNSDIIDISEYLGGKALKNVVGILFILFFFIGSFITLIDFCKMLQTIYFNNFSIIYIVLIFIIAAGTINLIGFKSIVRTICLIVPFALISILISFLGGFEEFSFENFTPFLGYNYRTTFVIGSINIFSMYILTYYFFLKPLLKDGINFNKITVISYIVSWILLFLTLVSILTLFPITNGTEPINTLYLLSRRIEVGTYIQRVDTIFIFVWIMCIFSYLSVTVFFINRIIRKLTNIFDEKIITFSTCSILLGIGLLPLNIAQIKFLENNFYKYMIIIIGFIFTILISVLANVKFKFKKGNKNTI